MAESREEITGRDTSGAAARREDLGRGRDPLGAPRRGRRHFPSGNVRPGGEGEWGGLLWCPIPTGDSLGDREGTGWVGGTRRARGWVGGHKEGHDPHAGPTGAEPAPCPTLDTDTRPRGARSARPAVTAALWGRFLGGPQSPPPQPRAAGRPQHPGARPGAPPRHTHQIAMCRWLPLPLLPVPSTTPGKGSLPRLTPPAPGAPRGHPQGDTAGVSPPAAAGSGSG